MSQTRKFTKKNKKPWPTKAAMEQVYELNLWGGKEHEYYSGEGSHNIEIVNPYINSIQAFLTSFTKPLSICDLGCGDFNIGKQLINSAKNYTAIDIVPSLISRNQSLFKAPNLSFICLDIAVDDLPKADCVIIRQVLQHLSNKEIIQVVKKLYTYKYVILTEHLPTGNFEPNKDIISGQGIRIKKQSGVDILAAPFNFKVKSASELLSYSLENNKGRLITTLYEV